MHVKKRLIDWLARRLPPCKEVARMASDSMDRKLPLSQKIRMRLHFMICKWCLRYFKQLQFMSEIAHQHDEQSTEEKSSPSLSPEARERMKRSFRA